MKQWNNRGQSSIKLTPKQASLNKNEVFVHETFLDKRRKIKPKFQVNDFARVADSKKTFSKRDTTNWSYKLYKTAEINNETKASYRIDTLPERYNEALLKRQSYQGKKKKMLRKP